MAGSSADDAKHPPAGIVSITVLSVKSTGDVRFVFGVRLWF